MTNAIFSNLSTTTIVVFGLIYTIWAIHLIINDASIIDLAWGAGFGITAGVLWYIVPAKTPYLTLLAALPILWAIRYTTFIFRRNLGKGEDDRYTILREKVRDRGQAWPLFSFWAVYGFQAVSMLLVTAPLIIGMAAPESVRIGPLPIIGALLWLAGFLFEAIADAQLERFKAHNKDYNGPYEDKPLLTTGLWKYSRHPNYFGNACIWWGIALVAIIAPYGWIGLAGAAYMNFVLVKLTGKANNESKMIRRKAYQDYIERTSGFIPLPPKRNGSSEFYSPK